jgi:cyclic dehypoxanthinyl futalosine synthase
MGISREQALDCFRSEDLIGLGMEADAVRRRLHPDGVVSYAVECAVDAGGGRGGRVEEICREIRDVVEMDGAGVRLQLGLDASACEIERVEGVLRGVRRQFPAIWLEGLTVAEVSAIARGCGLGLPETIARLRDAGMDAIAGDAVGAGANRVQEWTEVQRAAHGAGMRTAAAMVFGAGGFAERVELLEAVRRMQEETGGFAAFVPLCGVPDGASAGGGLGGDAEAPTAVEYLKTLAIARMFLDNVENVQSSGATQGLKVLQMGLRFGANDAGAVEVGGAGKRMSGATEEDLRRVIRDAGFRPAQRDMIYQTMFLN